MTAAPAPEPATDPADRAPDGGTDCAPDGGTDGGTDRALLRLLDTLEREGLDPHAIVVRHHGEVILDAAWAPYRSGGAALVYSASKTFTSLAIGFLAAEERLALTDLVDEHLDVPNPFGITVQQLLTMSTGPSREQTLALPFSVRALLTTPPAHGPGSHFAYSSPATYALSALVTALTGDTLTDYLRPRLLDPLGIGPRWWCTTDGLEQGYSGLHVSAHDLAAVADLLRTGGLLESSGSAHGRPARRVLPAEYVEALAQPWSDTREPGAPRVDNGEPDTAAHDWSLGYGLGVWRSMRGFRLDGAYGQLGLVVPEVGLAIGYQGATRDAGRALAAFWELADALAAQSDSSGPSDSSGSSALSDSSGPSDSSGSSAPSELAARTHVLDSWDARDLLVAAPEPAPSIEGWELHDADTVDTPDTADTADTPDPADTAGPATGWILQIPGGGPHPGGAVPVGVDEWAHTVLGAGDALLALAARGERRADGTVRAHLVVTTSPHRLLLERDAAGRLSAAWHTAPLWQGDLATLLVPPLVLPPSPNGIPTTPERDGFDPRTGRFRPPNGIPPGLTPTPDSPDLSEHPT